MKARDKTLLEFTLFKDVTATNKDQLLQIGYLQERQPGDVIVKEGDTNRDIFIVLDGTIAIQKHDPHTNQLFSIAHATQGTLLGEMAFLEGNPRSATAVAETQVHLFVLPYEPMQRLKKEDPSLYFQLLTSIYKDTSRKLRDSNARTIQALKEELQAKKAKLQTAYFAIQIIIAMSLYSLLIKISSFLQSRFFIDTWFSIWVGILFAFFAYLIAKQGQMSFEKMGIQLHNWQSSALEAIAFTLPLMALIVAIKWVVIHLFHYPEEPLFYTIFSYDRMHTHLSIPLRSALIALYIALVPLQEIVARGILQGTIAQLLENKWTPILASNLVFAASHLHLSVVFFLIVFLPGLFWGWLYEKQQTLMGVFVSHALLGVWTLHVVGIKTFTGI